MVQVRELRGPADLHAHSSVSDGTESPSELVHAARRAGLGVVALTDHDSTAGWPDAKVAARATGVTVIPGMEFSTRIGERSVHLLAYLIDPLHEDLLNETEQIRESRLRRAEDIVNRISVDYDLDWDDVVAQTAPGATIGRPHIADALVARGHAPDRSAAFAGILHWRSGYFSAHYAPDPVRAVELVRAAGGVPVLAHPATRGRDRVLDQGTFDRLVAAGLFGLEIDHRENTEDGKERLRELADQYGLVLTGSSDYHGAGKPNRLGENTTPLDVVQRIIAEGSGAEPFYG